MRHSNLVELRWHGIHKTQLYVATSWAEPDQAPSWPVPIRTLLVQVESAARGVAALHTAGLVHGDLKPETMQRVGDRGLICDLKFTAPAGKRAEAGFSPKFAAPEQVLGENVTPASDVYALGVTLYTLFIRERFPALLGSGSATMVGAGGMALSASTTIGAALEPGARSANRSEDAVVGIKVLFHNRLARVAEGVMNAELMAAILAIIQRACELDAERRYTDAGEFANALAGLL